MRPAHFILLLTFVTSLSLHSNIFNRDLIGIHAWRQMQNQWNIRNFYRYDNNILHPRIAAHNLGHDGNILRYEFPLMQWSIAQTERIFGESISVTRFVMFLAGFIGLLGFYALGKEIFGDPLLAACGAWIMSLAPLFYYYTLNPISDIWAMTAQIWMLAFAIRYFRQNQFIQFVLSVLCLCISALCKLPYVIFGIVPFLVMLHKYMYTDTGAQRFIKSSFILLIFILPVAVWYIYAISSWQSMGVLSGIFGSQDKTELKSYFINSIDHWLPSQLMNPAMFIVFILGLLLVFLFKKKSHLFWILASGGVIAIVYYLYEVNMIARIHDYYMLPFLVFIHLVILEGLSLFWKHRMTLYLSILGLAILPSLVYPNVNKEYWSIDRNGYNVDWFYHSPLLAAAAPRDSLCIILNDNTGTVKPYTVDKQGYVFDKDDLPAPWVEDMILHRRATYMYSDSRKIDSSQAIIPFLDSLILQAGSVKVFKLIKPESFRARVRH